MHDKFFEVVTDLLAITSRNGYFQWVSPGWTRVLGWTPEELTSRPWLEFVHPDDRERSKCEETSLFNGKESKCFENRYRAKSGTYRWLSWKTKPAEAEDELYYSAATDITGLKESELALQDALRLQQLVVESAEDFAIQVTDPQGCIEQWNPGAEKIFGFPKKEAIGQKTDLIFTPEDRAAEMPKKELETALRNGCAPDERWHLRKNGERVFISGMVRPLYTCERRLRGFVKIGRDQTERKHMEEQLREARENLERLVTVRTAKLEETVHQLEQFSYSLVHDLRAPLRSMSSFASLLRSGYADKLDGTGRNYLERIERSARRMDALIQDVLSYASLGQGTTAMTKVNLESLLRQVVGENEDFQPPRATITWDAPLLPVLGHDALLTQSIWNLLSNAVKFVAAGREPRVRIRTEPQGEQVRIWVEDNGIGIEPQYSARIFGMFEKLHRPAEYAGTGIGLAIVAKAVERMGGTVGFESQPGHGSRFWIQLPKG